MLRYRDSLRNLIRSQVVASHLDTYFSYGLEQMSGYVYLLVNERLPGLVKIGRTQRDPFARAAELRTTGVPSPFEVLATIRVSQPEVTERRLHTRLAEYRVSGDREFFELDAHEALRALFDEAHDVSPGNRLPAVELTVDPFEEAMASFREGPTYNPALGRAALELLAKKHHPKACLELGKIVYREPSRSQQSRVKKAGRYIELAAQSGEAEAFYLLACWHRDHNYADGWLRRLAEEEKLEAALLVARGKISALQMANDNFIPFPLIMSEKEFEIHHIKIFKALISDVKSTLTKKVLRMSVKDQTIMATMSNIEKEASCGARYRSVACLAYYTSFIKYIIKKHRVDVEVPEFAELILERVDSLILRLNTPESHRSHNVFYSFARSMSYPAHYNQ